MVGQQIRACFCGAISSSGDFALLQISQVGIVQTAQKLQAHWGLQPPLGCVSQPAEGPTCCSCLPAGLKVSAI